MVSCVCSGSMHQGNIIFKEENRNKQCMAISTACIIFKSLGFCFTSNAIHSILFEGDKYYSECRLKQRIQHIYLNMDDLLPEFSGFGVSIKFEINWGLNGLYDPMYPLQSKSNAKDLLHELIQNTCTISLGYIFTFCNNSVSFWMENSNSNKYYLFNSHAVSVLGELDSNNGAARLFKCNSLDDLVNLLFLNCQHLTSAKEYEIDYILNLNNIPIVRESNNVNNNVLPSLSENDINVMFVDNESHNSSSLDHLNENSNKKRAGRPKKNKGGRPIKLLKEDNYKERNIEVQRKARKSYEDKNPELVRMSRKVYEEKNPNRKSKEVYKEKNLDSAKKSKEVYKEKNPDLVKKSKEVYKQKHPDLIKKSKEMYKEKNPDSLKKSKEVYKEKNPDLVKKSKEVYKEKNPDLVKKSKEVYKEKNPDLVKKSKEVYKEKNPDLVKKSKEVYKEKNPDLIRKSIEMHKEKNPNSVRKSRDLYKEKNPELVRKSREIYKEKKGIARTAQRTDCENQSEIVNVINKRNSYSKYIPKELRNLNLIGTITCEMFDTVPLYKLKHDSLSSEMAYKCQSCNAAFFEEEKNRSEFCCRKGKLIVGELELQLLDAEFYKHGYFVKHARKFNNLFAFTAIGASGGFVNMESGVSLVKIQGRMYHRIFDLSYKDTVNNLALYIDDGTARREIAETLRNSRDEAIDNMILSQIETFLTLVNPFITELKRLALEPSEEAHIEFQEVSRSRDGPILGEQPSSREVAAIVRTDQQQYNPRQIIAWKIGAAKPHTIDLFSPCYETLQYPLIFPHGEAGWRVGLHAQDNKKISLLHYCRFRIMCDSRFTSMGRLSQEWYVDMYSRMEEERLQYLTHNQDVGLRIIGRDEIDETVEAEGGRDAGRIYLPSSFIGSPRYMLVKYQDAMCIVNRYGNVTYFITMTCNPNWVEIKNNLRPHEHATDRPDLCCRVFELKMGHLIHLLKSGCLFGELNYIFHVVEFQKRGLPHCHICVGIKGGGPTSNIEIDKVIRADIPTNERLRSIVLKHMIHGPCGNDYNNKKCFDPVTKKCAKFFPKEHVDVTHVNRNGFVQYKRDAFNTSSMQRAGHSVEVSDLFVVPYNPTLLLMFDCHINVELASTRKSVKYLFKYVTKGPAEARVGVFMEGQDKNEIELYATKRYIGASEAIWRIFSFDLISRYPNVIQLPVHLPGRENISFKVGHLQEAANKFISTLNIYLSRPRIESLENLTYTQFYEKYLTHTKKPNTKGLIFETVNKSHFITERQRGECIARLYWVQPNRGELYYLRILLSRYPCFDVEDLKIVNGVNYTTYQEAAIALGLVGTENEYVECMIEAQTFMTANRLRYFFCLLINVGAPAEFLWLKFKDALSEDFLISLNSDEAYNKGLCLIDRILRSQGSSNSLQGLPEVQDDSTEFDREYSRWNIEEQSSFVNEWLNRLNPLQKQVFDYVIDLVNNPYNNNCTLLYVDGPSGTGKTTLMRVITSYLRSRNHVVLCTASSGIAALNHEGGITAHSMFRLPINIQNNTYWFLSANSERAQLIRSSKVIIFDEAAMAHQNLLHCLDRSLRTLMHNQVPMGGKIFISLGDFRQIGPIVKRGSADDVVAASLINSYLWPLMKKFSLTEAMRTKEDSEYSSFLMDVGNGQVIPKCVENDNLIPLTNVKYVTEVSELINIVYPLDVLGNPDVCAERAILCGTYAHISYINSFILERIQGEKFEIYSADSIKECDADPNYLGLEALNLIRSPGVPYHFMEYKVGCLCIIVRNLDFEQGLINGSKVIIVGKSAHTIHVRKPNDSVVYYIPRIDFTFEVTGFRNIEMTRRAFPLIPCYSMSINKAQGQTIAFVGVDLRSDVFSHGMLYVALGRVRSRNNVIVLVPPERVIDGTAYTKNIVYPGLSM